MGKFNNFLSGTMQIIQLGQFVAGMIPRSAPKYEETPLENTSPMEGMASGEELAQYQYGKGGFYLGRTHSDHGQDFEVGISDDRHIFLVAGNASGKGRSILVQNALRWRGGLVAIDPKGELASITALRRGTKKEALGTGTNVRNFIGQEVVILDPFDECKGASRIYKKSYNPLTDIDIKTDAMQGQIKKLASACIVPEDGSNSHFSINGETLTAGTIEAVLLTQPKKNHTLSFVRQMLLKAFDGKDGLLEFLQDFDANGEKQTRLPADGLAAEAIGMLEEVVGSDEAGSFKTTLSKNWKWLSEPQMQRQVAVSDVSLKHAVQSGASLYVVVPPNRIADFKCWLRIILQTAFDAKIALGIDQPTQQTLFLIDEFPLLGRVQEIEQSAGFLRGFNCKLVPTIQNIGQIKTLYRDNWETFLGNAGAIIGFSTNDLETEKYLSDRMGKILAWETSFSVNSGASAQGMSGGSSHGKTASQAQRERAVRMPNEIHEQGARHTMRGFVVPADGKPFMVLRQNYDDIQGRGLFDSPQFIANWERRFRGKL